MATTDSYGKTIAALAPRQFATLVKRLPHGGSLQARKLANGSTQLYWRFSHEASTHREPIGVYDPTAPPKRLTATPKGYSVAAALETCRTLASTHALRAKTGGLREARAEETKAFGDRKRLEEARQHKTLEALMGTYVAHLVAQGRQSAPEVRNLVRLNVSEAWPKIARKPAIDVTADDVLDILRGLIEAGKGRSANKLRSYLRAAYQCAIDVRTTTTVPVAFKGYGITANPAAATKRSAQFDRADKRPLSLAELRIYLGCIGDMGGLQGATLRIHLLSGGQRIEQLVRLRTTDVREDSFTLYDAKGRPGSGAREHMLPMTAALAGDFKKLPGVGVYVFSTTKGKKPISSTTLASWARAAVSAKIPGFQLKRVRSGVETALAAHDVSREVRGHLQSHGLSGVQAKHYDAHDYLPQKRAALETLSTLLSI